MPPQSFAGLLRRGLLAFAVPLVPAAVVACDGGRSDPDPVYGAPRPTVPAPPREPTEPLDDPPPPPPPPPEGPGELLVPGLVSVLGATSDGFVAYFKGTVPAKSLEVYDTRKKVSQVLRPSTANSDYVTTSSGAVAFWTATRSPYGHGTLGFWSAVHGIVNVPLGRSLPYIFSASDDGARIAFMVGPISASTIGRIVNATPATAATAFEEVEPVVGTGCGPRLRHVGGRLFSSSCRFTDDVATTRGRDAAGKAVFTHTAVRPGVETSARGDLALTVKVGGGGTVVDMATAAERALPPDVTSAKLSPDGTFLLATTPAQALVRASTADPSVTETLLASGASEVLAIGPDGRHALVATAEVSRPGDFGPRRRYALALVSLTAPFTATPLVAATIATPRGFTASGKYVLYDVEVNASVSEVRARAVTGGTDITVGVNVSGLSPLPTTDAFVVDSYGVTPAGQSLRSSITKVDLDAPASPKVIASDVGAHAVVDRSVYFGAGEAGLRRLPIP